MPRFLLPPQQWSSERSFLQGDEAKHLAQVLRVRVGEEIVVFDGCGRRALARVLSVAKDRVEIELGDEERREIQGPELVLAQAIAKGKNMDWIVQKAVELGVSVIQPLVTKHTVVQPGEGKSDKWQRVALEACKQCGQDRVPEVLEPMKIDAWLDGLDASEELRVIASLAPGAKAFREVLRNGGGAPRVVYLVGPEGDFSGAEIDKCLSKGFQPVTLGEIVLRVETATMFGLSAIRYEYGV